MLKTNTLRKFRRTNLIISRFNNIYNVVDLELNIGDGNSSYCLTSEIHKRFLTTLRNAVISDEVEVSLPLIK